MLQDILCKAGLPGRANLRQIAWPLHVRDNDVIIAMLGHDHSFETATRTAIESRRAGVKWLSPVMQRCLLTPRKTVFCQSILHAFSAQVFDSDIKGFSRGVYGLTWGLKGLRT